MSDLESVSGQKVKKDLSKFFAKELTKALIPSQSSTQPIDDLVECAYRVIEALLKIKKDRRLDLQKAFAGFNSKQKQKVAKIINGRLDPKTQPPKIVETAIRICEILEFSAKERSQIRRKFIRHCQAAKDRLIEDDFKKHLPDTFLRDSYDHIDQTKQYVETSLEKGRNDYKKYRRLRDREDSISKRLSALESERFSDYIQEQIDEAKEEKQLTQEFNNKQAVSGPKNDKVELPPLTPKALVIYEKLCSLKPYNAMTLPKIQNWFCNEYQKNIKTPKDLDEGTWKNIRKELLPYGLKNKPRTGYYIRKNNI